MNESLFEITERIFIYLPYVIGTLSILVSLFALLRTIKERQRMQEEMDKDFQKMEERVKEKLHEGVKNG